MKKSEAFYAGQLANARSVLTYFREVRTRAAQEARKAPAGSHARLYWSAALMACTCHAKAMRRRAAHRIRQGAGREEGEGERMNEGVRGRRTREERRAIGDHDAPKVPPAAGRCAEVVGVGIPAARSRYRFTLDGRDSYQSPGSLGYIAAHTHHDRWSGDGTVDGE